MKETLVVVNGKNSLNVRPFPTERRERNQKYIHFNIFGIKLFKVNTHKNLTRSLGGRFTKKGVSFNVGKRYLGFNSK
jgi:hypothetical protein